MTNDSKPYTLDPKDLNISEFIQRNSGFGQDNIGVRVEHVPSGTFATCFTERSQHANVAKAKEVLSEMLKSYKPEDGRIIETPDTPLSKMTAEHDKLLELLVRCAETNMVPTASQIADARGLTSIVASDAVNQHQAPEPVIRFKKWVCNIRLSEYENGRLRIDLISAEDDEKTGVFAGEPIACATVNLPDHSIDDDCVCIKDYSENETMLSVLTSEGLIGSTVRTISSGHVNIPVVFKTEELMALERAFREDASQESGIIQTRNMM